MRAPTLALLSRGLRVDSRALWPYIVRSLLLVALMLFLANAAVNAITASAAGLDYLSAITLLTFFFISLMGTTVFAVLVTQEKEDNALGLLKMAGLGPLAILLGKAGSSLMAVIILILAQLPFTLLAVTLGGIDVNQILAIYLALLAYAVFLLGLGLFCSVISRRSSGAAAMMFILGLGFFIVPPLGGLIISAMTGAGWIDPDGAIAIASQTLFDWMGAALVLRRLHAVLTSGFSDPILGAQVVSNVVMGLCLFVLTWLVFETFTREEHDAAPGRMTVASKKSIFRVFGAPRAWKAALVWKDFFFLTGGRLALIGKFALCGGFFGFVWYLMARHSFSFRVQDLGSVTIVAMIVIAGIDLTVQASRIFSEEVKWKTLPNIMMLPRTAGHLIRRKMLAVLLTETPYIVFFIVGWALCSKDMNDFLRHAVRETVFWAVVAGAGFFLCLVAYLSLWVKHGAIPLAMLLVFILVMIVSVALLIPTVIFGFSRNSTNIVGGIICAAFVVLTLVVWRLLPRRLETLGGE